MTQTLYAHMNKRYKHTYTHTHTTACDLVVLLYPWFLQLSLSDLSVILLHDSGSQGIILSGTCVSLSIREEQLKICSMKNFLTKHFVLHCVSLIFKPAEMVVFATYDLKERLRDSASSYFLRRGITLPLIWMIKIDAMPNIWMFWISL
jgi:hypothetical protein